MLKLRETIVEQKLKAKAKQASNFCLSGAGMTCRWNIAMKNKQSVRLGWSRQGLASLQKPYSSCWLSAQQLRSIGAP